MCLAKSDQYPALCRDVFHRQSRPPPVMPAAVFVRIEQRREPPRRLDLPDTLQAICQRLLFDLPLAVLADVLQRAASAPAEYGSARLDSRR